MNFFHPAVAFFKRLRRNSYSDPARDWLMLVALALIAFAVILVWAAWVFDTVSRGGTIGAPTAVKLPNFDSSSLTTIHNVFDSRAAEESKYESGVYHFDDPSQ